MRRRSCRGRRRRGCRGGIPPFTTLLLFINHHYVQKLRHLSHPHNSLKNKRKKAQNTIKSTNREEKEITKDHVEHGDQIPTAATLSPRSQIFASKLREETGRPEIRHRRHAEKLAGEGNAGWKDRSDPAGTRHARHRTLETRGEAAAATTTTEAAPLSSCNGRRGGKKVRSRGTGGRTTRRWC